MPFPHFNDFERQRIHRDAGHAIDSHGHVSRDSWERETREMREGPQTEIRLTNAELAIIKDMFADLHAKYSGEVQELERLTGPSGGSVNLANDEEKLAFLKKKLDLMDHNLGEKLFPNTAEKRG